MKRDWRKAQDYEFTKNLSSELWAWQFLRRNPEYKKDYDWFIAQWRALEADYGAAPNRDFSRWKLDPRAYAPDEITQGFCEDDKSCASPDGDKVMIECAMGAKWGFYKFPNSPEIEFPGVPDKLIWRELDVSVSTPHSKAQTHEMDLRFDLRLPLSKQLSSAKQKLVAAQRRFKQRGEGFNIMNLTGYIRLLDAGEDDDILETLFPGEAENFESHRCQSEKICNTDYRLLTVANIK